MSNIKIVECMGNYDIDSDENMGDSDKESSSTISTDLAMHLSDSSGIETDDIEVSVVHHSDIYNDAIYKNPYNSGGYQSSTVISLETFVDHLPPKIIINLLPSNDDQTFVADIRPSAGQ